MSEELTGGHGLAPFLHQAKTVKGKAAVGVINQALSAQNVYVFGELLAMPNVQQLAETEDKFTLDLLKVFAYGQYRDYKEMSTKGTPLTTNQEKKLKQLTIVSLAGVSKVIPYSVLLQQLEISELRELEDLIIDAISLGVITAQLDQEKGRLEVESTMGRDLKPEAIDNILSTLTNFNRQAETLLQGIQEKIDHANTMQKEEVRRKEDFDKKVENMKANVKVMGSGADMADYDPMDIHNDDRNRKGRKKGGVPSMLKTFGFGGGIDHSAVHSGYGHNVHGRLDKDKKK